MIHWFFIKLGDKYHMKYYIYKEINQPLKGNFDTGFRSGTFNFFQLQASKTTTLFLTYLISHICDRCIPPIPVLYPDTSLLTQEPGGKAVCPPSHWDNGEAGSAITWAQVQTVPGRAWKSSYSPLHRICSNVVLHKNLWFGLCNAGHFPDNNVSRNRIIF